MNILIVDDKPENLYMLEILLNGSGYKTISAKNGAEALGLAQSQIPDLIISDILMPVMDGYTLCRQFKKDNLLKNVPFIFYTATYTDPKDEEFGLSLGADRFILKPADPDTFLDVIQNLLNEVKNKNFELNNSEQVIPETVILKEYNTTLIRKLEDKMKQTEENERKLKKYIQELEENIEARKKEENLRIDAEERLKSVFDNTVVGLYRTTPKGEIILANPALIRMLGFNNFEDLKARDLKNEGFSINSPRTKFIELIEKNNQVFGYESVWNKVNGEPIFIRESGRAVKDKEGKTIFYDGVVEDITEMKKAEMEKERSQLQFKSVWEKSFDGMRIIDSNGIIVEVNEAYCKLVKKDREELIGKPFAIIYKGKRKEDIIKYKNEFSSGTIKPHFEYQDTLWNGELIWISLSNSFIESGYGTKNLLSIFRDISDQKEYENNLLLAKEKAEEMNKVKSYFFANMSHELRTPLIGILGFSEFLLEEYSENPEAADMAKTIYQGGHRLLDTLNMILNFSKIESDKTQFTLKEKNIIPLIKESVNLYSAFAAQSNIKLNLNIENEHIKCLVDENLFTNSINNLINNAVKFTPEGYVTVVTEINENNAIIKVIDTGIGIPKEKLDVIWDEFRQVSEGFSRSFEGTGLGLTIAKKYIELMGGNISAESEVGKGTTFIVTFPLSTSQININVKSDIFSKKETVNANIKKIDLLYVEDDPIAVKFVQKVIPQNYIVDVAENGEEAIEKSINKKYDCILMDINLRKGLDGVMITQKIRENPHYKETPIIAVTSYALEEDKTEFLSKGMTHYISKPFGKNILLDMLNDVFADK